MLSLTIVNLEIFVRVLFSRNFAYLKFHKNKTLTKLQIYSIGY